MVQAYIDKKSEEVISAHLAKIDEHKQMVSSFCFLLFCSQIVDYVIGKATDSLIYGMVDF